MQVPLCIRELRASKWGNTVLIQYCKRQGPRIAAEFHATVCLAIFRVPFFDFVKYALGYNMKAHSLVNLLHTVCDVRVLSGRLVTQTGLVTQTRPVAQMRPCEDSSQGMYWF
jgi:hypothetical protein